MQSGWAAQGVNREIKGGEHHRLTISLSAGDYLFVQVEQQGIDIVVTVYAADGKLLAEVNRPIGNQGPEPLHFISESSGPYILEVRAASASARAGRYSLQMMPARPAQLRNHLLVKAQRASNDAEQVRASGARQQLEASLMVFQAAVADYQAADDMAGAAFALFGQARTLHFLGQAPQALTLYQQALALFEQTDERNGKALTHYRIGGVYQSLDPPQATEHFSHATELARASGNTFIESKVLTNLGYGCWINGELPQASRHLERALQLQHELGDRYSEAESLVQLGGVFNELGEYQRGLETYQAAIRLHRAGGHKREEANALIGLADTHRWRGEAELAADILNKSLELARVGGYQVIEALGQIRLGTWNLELGRPQMALTHYSAALPLTGKESYYLGRPRTLLGMGRAHAALNHHQPALDFFAQALEEFKIQGLSNGQADVRYAAGQVYLKLAQPAQALAEFDQALSQFREVGDRLGEALTLLAQSRAHAVQKQWATAHACNDRALELIEVLRARLLDPGARASFLATVEEAYKQKIALLMEGQPVAGAESEAFRLSERARARSLLESLGEASVRLEQNTDPELLAELQRLQQTINGKAARRARLAGQKNSEPELREVNAELRAMTQELEMTRTRLIAASPRYASLTHPQTLNVAAVQSLLDTDSALIEYALGEERSYAWIVTSDEITSYKLPKRTELEAAARAFHQTLAANNPYLAQAAALSRLTLGPLAARLQKQRLLIVADGALQYVPFAALPSPGKTAQPLIVEHEVVNLPSASVLAALRREFGARPAAARSVTVFADPVFSRDDARVSASLEKNTSSVPEITRSANDLRRLPTTADEADAILGLAPQGSAFQIRGFQATRDSVLRTDLASYRILHFATHGWLDDAHPDLSWLALSMVDERGQPRDGFLRLHEIYNLKLNADLVVMSACQTALGREIKGEGLIGLTRGFMYAGAPRVVASLWQVNSTATAELMKRFYRGMFCENARPAALPAKRLVKQARKSSKCKNLPPAAALRAAQLELRQRGLSPYYWGGFVLQGEWR